MFQSWGVSVYRGGLGSNCVCERTGSSHRFNQRGESWRGGSRDGGAGAVSIFSSDGLRECRVHWFICRFDQMANAFFSSSQNVVIEVS